MGYIKVVKNKAYYKRFQVKFRRRREAKTDYFARKRLVTQDKNKYQSPKYRFVVRFTNTDIICQIFSTDLNHDVCIAAAYSHELKRYGLKVGFSNYAAAYATGLLLARRVNHKFGLNELYAGQTEVDGADYDITEDIKEEDKSPFKANLDVGLKRTTTGARIFGALKGATDGGLSIPHNDRRFPGSAKAEEEKKKWEPDADKHREYIFGIHVANYMRKLKEEDEEAYATQFKRYVDAKVGPDSVEESYANVHKGIRADPTKKRGPTELGHWKVRKEPKKADAKKFPGRPQARKITLSQRKNRIKQIITARIKKSSGGVAAS
eukprot:TRINITY_DN150_c0_g1_i1.p1 TRINITY_DN150_c0_g1~~TRINITY_DN150_c0_g1_i1.p1  ORF type:complete len:321 (+),score=47.40 TRINITY_DN150_c0_g1_i1:88-1050(+)